MNCALCFQKTNFKKLIEVADILNLIQFHFSWIKPQDDDIVCRKCWKILLDFNNYCREINDVHRKKSLIPIEPDIKLIEHNDELISFKTEIKDVVFDELHEFSEVDCGVDIPFKDLSPASDINDESSSLEELPILKVQDLQNIKAQPLNKVKSKRKSSYIRSQAKKEFDEEADKLIASFMKLNCYVCSMKFDTFAELKRHFKTEHKIKNGYTQCCKVRVYKRSQLVDHLKFCHINPEQLRCTICSKMLKSSNCLKWHMDNRHGDYPKPKRKYTCTNCNENFVSHIAYQRHLAKYLPEEEWKFKCEVEGCLKIFANEALRKDHFKAFHQKKICPECGKLVSSNHFSEHLARHSNDMAVTCDICNATFKSRRYLTVHKKRHSDENKIHKCPTCGKISPTSSALTKHISYVHNNNFKLHKCNVCEKTFKRRYILKQHLAVHTGQPLYNCGHCDRAFYYDSHYHAHRKSAHPIEFQNEQAATKAKRTNFNELNVYTKK